MRRTRGGCGAPLPLTAGAGPFPAPLRQHRPRRLYAFVHALGHSDTCFTVDTYALRVALCKCALGDVCSDTVDTYFRHVSPCFHSGSAAIGRSAMHSDSIDTCFRHVSPCFHSGSAAIGRPALRCSPLSTPFHVRLSLAVLPVAAAGRRCAAAPASARATRRRHCPRTRQVCPAVVVAGAAPHRLQPATCVAGALRAKAFVPLANTHSSAATSRTPRGARCAARPSMTLCLARSPRSSSAVV